MLHSVQNQQKLSPLGTEHLYTIHRLQLMTPLASLDIYIYIYNIYWPPRVLCTRPPQIVCMLATRLEGVEGDGSGDGHGRRERDDANHGEPSVLELHELELLELFGVLRHGGDLEVAGALGGGVLVLPVHLEGADRRDHLPDSRRGHLGGGGDGVESCEVSE